MLDHHESFVWYELLTTDMAAARAFYGRVLGWETSEASTPKLTYNLFTAANVSLGGLMELPEEGLRSGATPRWIGYVGVDDIEASASRIRRLGGSIYVPPTTTNIGRISVVADPQTASLGLVMGLTVSQQAPRARPGELGHVVWHELLAADWQKAFTFYSEVFGWERVDSETDLAGTYQLLSAGGQIIGGVFNKRALEPIPFWLYYFNVDDIDSAAERVRAGSGRIFEGPLELPDGSWIVRCVDPQGAMFALLGARNPNNIARSTAVELGWSSAWGEFSSKGRLRVTKPKS